MILQTTVMTHTNIIDRRRCFVNGLRLRVWNHNQNAEPVFEFGVLAVEP